MIVTIAALTQFTATFVGAMIAIALPKIYHDFSLSTETLNWITISFLTIFMAITIPLGKIISKFGLKKFTIICNFILIVGSILSVISIDVNMLIFSRIIQAIAVSGLSISVFMIVVEELPEKEVGPALGIVGSCGYIGLTSAPSIAGFIVHYLSWRYTFLFIVILASIQLVMLYIVKKEWSVESQSLDYVGMILYVVMMIIFIFGLTNITKKGIYGIILSIILLVILIKIEKKKENPLLNLKLFKNTNYVIGTYASLVTYFITFISTYMLNLYLQMQLGFDSHEAGLILLITPLVMVFISPIAGKLTEKYDPRVLSIIALLVLLVTLILLVFIQWMPFYLIIIAIIIQGIGHGLFSAPNNKYVLTIVDKNILSDATSVLATAKEFGKNLSLSLYNVICVIFVVNLKDFNSFAFSFDAIMSISILLTVIAIALLIYSKYKSRYIPDLAIASFLRSMIKRKQ